MLWERKIALEKEMAEVMDPTVGQDVVGEMKKEIHRMTLRHAELMRLQVRGWEEHCTKGGRRQSTRGKRRVTGGGEGGSPHDAVARRAHAAASAGRGEAGTGH